MVSPVTDSVLSELPLIYMVSIYQGIMYIVQDSEEFLNTKAETKLLTFRGHFALSSNDIIALYQNPAGLFWDERCRL